MQGNSDGASSLPSVHWLYNSTMRLALPPPHQVTVLQPLVRFLHVSVRNVLHFSHGERVTLCTKSGGGQWPILSMHRNTLLDLDRPIGTCLSWRCLCRRYLHVTSRLLTPDRSICTDDIGRCCSLPHVLGAVRVASSDWLEDKNMSVIIVDGVVSTQPNRSLPLVLIPLKQDLIFGKCSSL